MEPSAADVDDGSLIIRSGEKLPPYLLAVDPTRAATNFPVAVGVTSAQAEEFEAAAAAAAGYLGETDIRLCDVATAQVRGFPALQRPADSATPAIWARLPELPQITDYPSRILQLEQLKEARGRIVIHGKPGLGKSTLAGIRARTADGGYGWFLNATDRSALQSELAQAENDQRARGYQFPLEKADREPFADLAVRRLEVSSAPWVLVLDNANGNPRQLTPILPRTVGANQTIIVTTTNDEWLDVWPASDSEPCTLHVRLEALTSEDMPDLATGLRQLVEGSPLFYEAVRTAIASGANVPQAPESAAGLVWQLAQDYLASRPDALDLAHLIAWLPSVALPVTDLAGHLPDIGTAAGSLDLAQTLENAGVLRLLAQPVPSVLMHRSIAARIRDDDRLIGGDGRPSVPAPTALMAVGVGQDLMTRLGDSESFARLEAALGRERDPRVPARTWGYAVYGIARASEIQGRSRQSSALFAQAIDFLDQRLDLSVLSECWNGRARHLKDIASTDRATLLENASTAQVWAARARELATLAASGAPTGSAQELWDLIRAERAHAMEALCVRKQANLIKDSDERKAERAKALTMLEQSLESRRGYLEELGILDSPDIDRGIYNLGGSGIGLAKDSRGAEAERFLRGAWHAYEEAKQIRVKRYGEGYSLPSIASCDSGMALACYYGALLEADPTRDREAYRPITPEDRITLLRQASSADGEALRNRTVRAPADLESSDSVKSLKLTVKIDQVRQLVSAFYAREHIAPFSLKEANDLLDLKIVGESPSEAVPEALVLTEALEEARDLGGLIAPSSSGEAQA